jgi:hypothetical protein
MKLVELDLQDQGENAVYINVDCISQITVTDRGYCRIILNNGASYVVKKKVADFITELKKVGEF